jgi:hypothetical protein
MEKIYCYLLKAELTKNHIIQDINFDMVFQKKTRISPIEILYS